MRGQVDHQGQMFCVIDMERFVPQDHPLRGIKARVDAALRGMRRDFDRAYSAMGRPSIPPEQLIKATLLQGLFSIASEAKLCEHIQYNFLYRWFLDLPPEANAWDHSTFTKNRQRFADNGLMRRFFDSSVRRAIQEEAASDEHFSVDGTLIEAWASMKSFRPKDEPAVDEPGASNRWVDWKGEKRSNTTHESKTDPEARLARKGPGREAKLSHSTHLLMENRNSLLLDIMVSEANGHAERDAAVSMLQRVKQRDKTILGTVGADKGYDDGPFLDKLECDLLITPHVAVREGTIRDESEYAIWRLPARRRQRSKGYKISQRIRMRIEQVMGWVKTVAGLERTRFVGRWKTQLYAYAVGAAWNFLRLNNLAG